MFMYAVPDRTAATLLDTIRDCIAPGSIIISDLWASYQGIETMIGMNYTHQTVNHSENFVDPTTGAHTQTIETYIVCPYSKAGVPTLFQQRSPYHIYTYIRSPYHIYI